MITTNCDEFHTMSVSNVNDINENSLVTIMAELTVMRSVKVNLHSLLLAMKSLENKMYAHLLY